MSFVLTPRAKWRIHNAKKRELPEEFRRKAAAMYDKGAIDAEISLACKCSKQAVLNWRQETGRESNFKKRGWYDYADE